ncbi:Uncharacterized protein Rs2_05243 [Raphanus sativus]|nr:Uncharacterized protein Rs2_05243 [Raphanus sativus]
MSHSKSYIPNIVVGGGFGGPGDLSRRCPVVLFRRLQRRLSTGKGVGDCVSGEGLGSRSRRRSPPDRDDEAFICHASSVLPRLITWRCVLRCAVAGLGLGFFQLGLEFVLVRGLVCVSGLGYRLGRFGPCIMFSV